MAEPMKHVDLCSGIGGFALGFEWAGLSKPVLFCDIEPWSRKVLAKHWPDVPIAHDVKELANDPARLVPDCDILSCGYPCQPFSVAGKQRGTEDDRHIWPEIFKIIQAKRPTWIVCENVSGHISLGLNQVLSDLEDKAGYAVQTFCVGAVSVNAPHRRQRIWIVANSSSLRRDTGGAEQSLQGPWTSSKTRWEIAAHTNSHGQPDGTINEQRMVGNAEHDGSSAATVSGKHGQDEAGCKEGQSASKQSEGASEPRHDANVADTNDKGLRSRIGGSDSQSFEKGGKRRNYDNRSCTNGKFENITESQNIQKDVAYTDDEGSQGRLLRRQNTEWQGEHGHARCSGAAHRQPAKDWWAVEPAVGRVAHGIPGRVDRLRGLGNAIVPQIAMQIGLTIKAVRDG